MRKNPKAVIPKAVFQYVKGAYRKDGEMIFSRACCDRTRSNDFKLREGRYREGIFLP